MLMTQSAVSALQGQNSTPYNGRRNTAGAQGQIGDRNEQSSLDFSSVDPTTQRAYHQSQQATTSMNGIATPAPPGAMYVRALYDYEADDRTSLSFHEGDIIQVITQLESGWWDGVINGVRGWFPSNYCQIIATPDDLPEIEHHAEMEQVEEEPEEQDAYEAEFDDEEEPSDLEDNAVLPIEGGDGERSRADFWIPQATPDGRLFYYNTMTGESSMELPLESPSSINETGPRDRMNVNVPERTRPPPEMMARGFLQDEGDESDGNSASELEGENILAAARGSNVSHLLHLPCPILSRDPAWWYFGMERPNPSYFFWHTHHLLPSLVIAFILLTSLSRSRACVSRSPTMAYRLRRPWTR